ISGDLSALIVSTPHLTARWSAIGAKSDVLKRGYIVGFAGSCSGCVLAPVRFTQQTDPADINHLSRLNFNCLTHYKPCEHEADILPSAWGERNPSDFNPPPDTVRCDASI